MDIALGIQRALILPTYVHFLCILLVGNVNILILIHNVKTTLTVIIYASTNTL